MNLILFLALFVIKSVSTHPVKCPGSFDFSAESSCFKYVDDQMFRYDGAKAYCENTIGGRLAILDSRKKFKATIKYFHGKFSEEQEEGGVPTAWVQGQWIPGTTRLKYSDGRVERHPHWMTPTHNTRTGRPFRWPTSTLFGWDAKCVAVSLWKPSIPDLGIRSSSGIYNVPCNSIYWTHALCEVTK